MRSNGVRTLIVGGQVVDGSGAEPIEADVLIVDDRIVAVEPAACPSLTKGRFGMNLL